MIDLIKYHHETVEPTIDCLDHGHVKLLDMMPRVGDKGVNGLTPLTADFAILDAARQSYAGNQKSHTREEDRGLIRYLMRHRHTTPFEMVELKFHCRLPIFVARQMIRHRMASVNEASGRYSKLPSEFYVPMPDQVRAQSNTNKQGSEGNVSDLTSELWSSNTSEASKVAYNGYEIALKANVAKELARINLPLNLYTEWYWKIDLHNLLRFISLRSDSHAQHEIQVYSNAMLELIKPLVPWTIEAWEDFDPLRGAIVLTRLEVEALRNSTCLDEGRATKREQSEWVEKKKKLGL